MTILIVGATGLIGSATALALLKEGQRVRVLVREPARQPQHVSELQRAGAELVSGDLTDPGEGLGRWASNGTTGSEFTGLYFDPRSKRRAWVNIQHPASGNDRTIEITLPGGGDDDGDDRDDHDD